MIFRDRYWVLSKLGEGGMGITYRVWDSLQRNPAVIKVPKVGGSPDTARRFVQELHAMLALKHEHIVPITSPSSSCDSCPGAPSPTTVAAATRTAIRRVCCIAGYRVSRRRSTSCTATAFYTAT